MWLCRARLASIAVEYDAARHAEVRAHVERLTPLAARATSSRARWSANARCWTIASGPHAGLRQIEARVAALSAQRDSLAFSEEVYAELRDRHEQAATELRAAELTAVAARLGPSPRRWTALDVRGARARGVAQERSAPRASDKERRLHEELDRAFSDLRTDLNQSCAPRSPTWRAAYLRELTDGRYSEIELDDQYNVTVLEDGDSEAGHLRRRRGSSEPRASACNLRDDRGARRSELLTAHPRRGVRVARRGAPPQRRGPVARLQDRFEQVILITHIESVRDGLDRVISVRYDEESGVSRVERPRRRAVSTVRCARRSGGLMATSRVLAPATDRGPFRAAARRDHRTESGVQRRVHGAVPARWDGRRPRPVPQSGDLALRDRGRGRGRDALARRARSHRRVQHGAPLGQPRAGWVHSPCERSIRAPG